MVEKVNGLLSEMRDEVSSIDVDDVDQDFYRLRSRLFLYRAVALLERRGSPDDLRKEYAKMVENFVRTVSPYRVWNYDDFKKRQYDAELFYILFENDADDLYEYLFSSSSNHFVLQQWALYHRKTGNLKRAFTEIETVLKRYPNNPSIKSSHAMIMFESAMNDEGDEAIARMKKAMNVLEELHSTDLRKEYNTERYANYALVFANTKNDYSYIDRAIEWINVARFDGNRRRKDRLLQDLHTAKRKNSKQGNIKD